MGEGQHVARLAVKGDTRNAAKELVTLRKRETELERQLAKTNEELIRHATAHQRAGESAAHAAERVRRAGVAEQRNVAENAKRFREAMQERVQVTQRSLAAHLKAIEQEKVARLQQIAVEQRGAKTAADAYRLQDQADRVRHNARMMRFRAEQAAAQNAAAVARRNAAERSAADAAQTQLTVDAARRQAEVLRSRSRVSRANLDKHIALIEREKVARLKQIDVERRGARTAADAYRLQNQADKVRHDARMARLRAEQAAQENAQQAQRARMAALGQVAGGAAIGAAVADRAATRALAVQNLQQNLPFSIDGARASTQGLVADFDLMRQAIAANRLGVARSAEDFAELARIATTLGVSLGQDATQSLEDLTNGLGRASTEVLDNLGITMRAEDAHRIYAKRLGKTTRELDDMEKRQAVVTVGLERGAEAASKASVAVDGLAAAWAKAKTQAINLLDSIVNLDDAARELAREGLLAVGQTGREAETTLDKAGDAAALYGRITAGVFTLGLSEAGIAAYDFVTATDEIAESIQRGQPSYNVFVDFLRRSGSVSDRATSMLRDMAAAAGEVADNVAVARKKQFLEEQIQGIQFLVDFAAPVEKELEKWRKEQREKAAEAARQAAEAALAVSVEEVRREREVLEQKVRDREATTEDLVALIHVQAEAERQLAEFQFTTAQSRADQIQAANAFNAAQHSENMAILAAERQEREALLRLHERAAQAHSAYVSTVAEQEIGAIQRRNELERAQLDLRDQRAMGGLSPDQAQDMARSQAVQRVRDEATANDRLREAELLRIEQQRANTTDRLELMRLEGEAEQLYHEAQLDRVRVMAAEESKRLAEEQIRTRQRLQLRRQLARESTQFGASMANAAIGIRRAEDAAAEAAREAGESEAAARKKARGEGLIALGQDMQGRAISHTAAGTAAFIMGNPIAGGQNMAAAGVFFLAGRTLMGIGEGMTSSAGGGGGGAVGGTSFGGGGGAPAANGSTGLPSSEIPPSPRPGAAPQPGNPAGGAANDPVPGGAAGSRTVNINISALSVDREAARQIQSAIVELAAAEGF